MKKSKPSPSIENVIVISDTEKGLTTTESNRIIIDMANNRKNIYKIVETLEGFLRSHEEDK